MKPALPTLLLFLSFCLGTPVYASQASESDSTTSTNSEETVSRNPEPTARYLLRDASNGRAVSNEDFPGLFQLVTFGYTFCPDICPTTLAEISVIMERLGGKAEQLQPIFITVDPERDTSAVLHSYTRFFHPRILGLTGSPALVKSAAENFRVRYEIAREPGAPEGQYAIDHSAGMYLLGPDGRYIRKFAYGTAPTEIAERITEIIAKHPLSGRRPSARQR